MTLSRRRLLVAGAGGLAALAFREPDTPAPAAGPPPFQQPKELRAEGGVLETTLRVARSAVRVEEPGGSRAVTARAYDGRVPGPTLRLRAGDRLDLHLVNDLPAELPPCGGAFGGENAPHGFDTTNLHTHGLHVSPASVYPSGDSPRVDSPGTSSGRPLLASDDVLLAIGPGESQRYRLWLPAFHAPGTHWYHAHKHGSAALQVGSGLVGALIVDDPPGSELVAGEDDRVFVLHELLGDDAPLVYTRNAPPTRLYVNGAFQPVVPLRPGAVQRWRFVNATGSLGGWVRLRLLDGEDRARPLHLVAVDGIAFYGKPPQRRLEWSLPPGGRADVLVRLDDEGPYRLVQEGAGDDPASSRQLLAAVEVAGRRAAGRWPAVVPGAAPPYLAPIAAAEARGNVVRFSIARPAEAAGPCGLITNDFLINEKKYERSRLDHDLALGEAVEWTLTNSSAMGHAFHVHVNPFQVADGPDHLIDPAGADVAENWLWRDTVGVPAGSAEKPGQVTIRMRPATYPGSFVLHCHILVHEDLGMMQNVRVHGDGAPPCVAVPGPPAEDDGAEPATP